LNRRIVKKKHRNHYSTGIDSIHLAPINNLDMKHNRIVIFFIVSLLFFALALPAQKTAIYTTENKTYNDALQLFQQENYGAASVLFQQVKKDIDDPSNIFYEDAEYYLTLSAIYLGNTDAFRRVNEFSDNYPESAWLPSIQFELGKLYFGKRRYSQALQAFNKSRPGQLSRDQRDEFHYKKGYSLLSLGKEDAALRSFSSVSGSNSSFASAASFYTAHIHYSEGEYNKALTEFEALKDNRRFSKYVSNYLIHIYFELGEYQRVVDEGTAFLKKADRKTRGGMAGLVANAYYNLGDYASALQYFEMYEINARKELSPAEHYRIGYTKYVNEKYRAAIHNFQEASKGSEEFAQNAWYHLGFCYINTSELKFAQNAFLKAYKMEGPRELKTDALYNYVKLTIEIGSDLYNDPVEIVESFIEEHPDLPRIDEAYDLLAQLYLTSRKYNSALHSIEKTTSPNPKLQAIYQQIAYTQAIDYFNKGDYLNAISYLEKALYYTPDRELEARSVFWFGDALYRMKKYNEAAGKFSQFLGLRAAKQTAFYGNGMYNLAYAYFNQRKYSNASDYFGRFLKLSDQDPNLQNDAKLRLADSYFIMKDYDNALTWYNRVINNGAKDVDYAIYQKAFCYGADGDFNKKISTLKTLVKGYPTSLLYDDALYEIASTSLILNDQRGAIVYYDKLVKERPRSPFAKKALIKMGFVYYNGNQYDQAIRTLKRVVDKYPASLEAKEALNTLQNIYMDQGRVDEYFAYARSLDFVQVSQGEEDSLTFVTGENYYIDNDCNNAISAFRNYLRQFPNGGFVLMANNYLATCYERQGNTAQAIQYYTNITEFPDNQYTDKALLKTARFAFDEKDYSTAKQQYSGINESADDPGMILEARDGAMRSAYLMGDNKSAIYYADQLKEMPNATENQLVYAHYVSGKIHLLSNNEGNAEKEFSIVDEMTSGELGAEAKYQLAQIRFNRGQLDEAETAIYQLPEQYPGYDYWIASAFILLADIYMERDNAFQAEQTLLSVIDNYPGDDLKAVAREKLEKIKPAESGEENNELE
jgi:TolA-binding protein